jgi:hypothetical protein
MAENTNKITISEFKSWLEGITDLQGDDWSPDAKQWVKIKTKLFSIEGFDVPVARQITMLVERALSQIRWQNFTPQQPANYDWRQEQPIGGPANAPPAGQPNPGQPLALPVGQPPVMTPGGSSLTGASAATPPLTLPPGSRIGNMDPTNAVKIEGIKTPDVDTSGGTYKSQFL